MDCKRGLQKKNNLALTSAIKVFSAFSHFELTESIDPKTADNIAASLCPVINNSWAYSVSIPSLYLKD